jgi:PKD repeat protein
MKYKVILLLTASLFSINLVLGNNKPVTNCTSHFSWEKLEGSNTGIQFTNLSSGDFNSWEWDFGDGIISEVCHPVHEYSSYGTYYVCLSITDGVSCTDVFCDTVVVEPECVANFNFTYVPTTPIYVQFTDLSTGNPDSWLWDFGDGNTSTNPNPVHPYVIPGSYDVCLIIEHNDSLFSCVDSICKTVIIPDSLNCEADYAYYIDPDDPLKVHFTDFSNGNITDWEWNFGDGSISNEQNPVHVFPGPADYMVCLKVENSDTSEHCIHFICKTIHIEDPDFCTAEFSLLADSSSHVMYHYTFMDESSGNPDLWLWDFGDGHISHDQNPVHVYEEPGTYKVCLDTWNSNYPGCTDSYCVLIKTADYFQLGGLAFIGDNPINNPVHAGDTGLAVIYRQTYNNNILAIDTTKFHELGYYWFSNMMHMGYRIKVSLSRGSTNYADFIPSYYPGSIYWQQADEFMLSEDLFEMNTELIQAEGVDNGPGLIKGQLIIENRYGAEIHGSVDQVPVILISQQNIPLAWTATNESGQFAFENIALGNYILKADVVGMWAETLAVNLTNGYPVNDSVQIKVAQDSPFGINEAEKSFRLHSLYPNPAEDHINLELNAKEHSPIVMNVYNLTGNLLHSRQYMLITGNNTIMLNTEEYPPGLYMINVIDQLHSEAISKKFVKK